MPADGLLDLFFPPESTTQFQFQHICKSNEAKNASSLCQYYIGMIRFPGSDFRAEVPPNLCEQEEDDAPHMSTLSEPQTCVSLSVLFLHTVQYF